MNEYKYLLVKLATIEKGSIFNKEGNVILPTTDSYHYKEEWKHFTERYKGELEIIAQYTYQQYSVDGRTSFGNEISELKVGSSFVIYSNISNTLRTSLVKEIITSNIFITYNSVYLIINRQNEIREQKLNELLCQNLKKSG